MIPLTRILVKLIKIEMVVARGWTEAKMGSCYSMDIKFQSGNSARKPRYNIVLTVNKMYKVIKNVDFLREVLGLLEH